MKALALTKEIDIDKTLKSLIDELEEGKEESKEKNFLEDLQRVQADFENYIKRVDKEKDSDREVSESEEIEEKEIIEEGEIMELSNPEDEESFEEVGGREGSEELM